VCLFYEKHIIRIPYLQSHYHTLSNALNKTLSQIKAIT